MEDATALMDLVLFWLFFVGSWGSTVFSSVNYRIVVHRLMVTTDVLVLIVRFFPVLLFSFLFCSRCSKHNYSVFVKLKFLSTILAVFKILLRWIRT